MTNYSLEQLKILIVGDDGRTCAHLKSILYGLGVQNHVKAARGADAFRRLRLFPADIIICDRNISPLAGMDFVRLVRTGKDGTNPYVPIVMLIGYKETKQAAESDNAGVHEFVTKPFSAKSLHASLHSILETPRPFIRAGAYFGPDRRRRDDLDYRGMERRWERVCYGGGKSDNWALSRAEMSALLNG